MTLSTMEKMRTKKNNSKKTCWISPSTWQISYLTKPSLLRCNLINNKNFSYGQEPKPTTSEVCSIRKSSEMS